MHTPNVVSDKKMSSVDVLKLDVFQMLPEWSHRIHTLKYEEVEDALLCDKNASELIISESLNLRRVVHECLTLYRKIWPHIPEFEVVEADKEYRCFAQRYLADYCDDKSKISVDTMIFKAKCQSKMGELMAFDKRYRKVFEEELLKVIIANYKFLSRYIEIMKQSLFFEEAIASHHSIDRFNVRRKYHMKELVPVIRHCFQVKGEGENPYLEFKVELEILKFLMGDPCEFDNVLKVLRLPTVEWFKNRIPFVFCESSELWDFELEEVETDPYKSIKFDPFESKLSVQTKCQLSIKNKAQKLITIELLIECSSLIPESFEEDVLVKRSLSVLNIKIDSSDIDDEFEKMLSKICSEIYDIDRFFEKMRFYPTRLEESDLWKNKVQRLVELSQMNQSVSGKISRRKESKENGAQESSSFKRAHSSRTSSRKKTKVPMIKTRIGSEGNLSGLQNSMKVFRIRSPRRSPRGDAAISLLQDSILLRRGKGSVRKDKTESQFRQEIIDKIPLILSDIETHSYDPKILSEKMQLQLESYQELLGEEKWKHIILEEIVGAILKFKDDSYRLNLLLRRFRYKSEADEHLNNLGQLSVCRLMNHSSFLTNLFSRTVNIEVLRMTKEGEQEPDRAIKLRCLKVLASKMYQCGWEDLLFGRSGETPELLQIVSEIQARRILLNYAYPIYGAMNAVLQDSKWVKGKLDDIFPSIHKSKFPKNALGESIFSSKLLPLKTRLQIMGKKRLTPSKRLFVKHFYTFKIYEINGNPKENAYLKVCDQKLGIAENKKTPFRRKWKRSIEIMDIEFSKGTSYLFIHRLLLAMYQDANLRKYIKK